MMEKYVSQREPTFKGGIQKGMVALDESSKSLDLHLKQLREEIYQELKYKGFSYKKNICKDELRKYGIEIGFYPDGGIWYKDDIPVAIFEAKKQGNQGNAIERWCKNNSIAKFLFGDIRYVTFGIREGFDGSSYAARFAKSFLKMENKDKTVNIIYNTGQSWLISKTGFSKEEIKKNMIDAIIGENLV
jgi:hypothetical protein